MARNAAKKEAKQLLRNGKKLGVIGRRGARKTVKNGKMMYGGIKNGFAKGSKHLDDLGKNLGKKFRFRKFKFQIQKRRFKLLGEINPWVLLASGEVKWDKSVKGQAGDIVSSGGVDAIIIGGRKGIIWQISLRSQEN